MKQLILKTTLILFVFSVSSCIVVLPKKKYDALIKEKNTLADNLDKANKNIDDLNKQLKLQKDTVAMLRKDTADLNEKLHDSYRQLANLNDNYKQLRMNSSEEIKKLLKQLEDAQSDLASREKRLKEVEEVLSKREDATKALKDKLAQALLGFKNSGLEVSVKDGKVYVSLTDKLLFDTGSIEIDSKGKEALVEFAKVLKSQPDINILVEGHTDNVRVSNLGQIKDNWDLSVLRATAVTRFLTEGQKLDATRLTASGRGEFFPLEKINTPEARSKNRRIEIILSPKLDELYHLLNSN